MEIMTINGLITAAHNSSKARGSWDKPNIGEKLMLIVSSCGKALEAHMSGKRANLRRFDDYLEKDLDSELWISAFDGIIKGSFEDELACIAIGIADYLGRIGYVDEQSDDGLSVNYGHGFTGNVGESLMHVVHNLCAADVEPHIDKRIDLVSYEEAIDPLMEAIWCVSGIAQSHGIDLWRHIRLALENDNLKSSQK